MSDLHPDQLDVPEQRPPADQSDAQSVDKNLPDSMPSKSSQEVLVDGNPLPEINSDLVQHLPEEDRYMAVLHHMAMQPIAGLTPQQEADRRKEIVQRAQWFHFGHRLAVPVIGVCCSTVSLIVMHGQHVSAPWSIGAGLGAVGSGGILTYRVAKKKVESSRRKKQAKQSAAAEADPISRSDA